MYNIHAYIYIYIHICMLRRAKRIASHSSYVLLTTTSLTTCKAASITPLLHTYVHINIPYTYVRTYMYVYVWACVYIYMYVCMYVCLYSPAHTYNRDTQCTDLIGILQSNPISPAQSTRSINLSIYLYRNPVQSSSVPRAVSHHPLFQWRLCRSC